MAEHSESNYTKEDLRHFNFSEEEIENINGHSLGDGERDSFINVGNPALIYRKAEKTQEKGDDTDRISKVFQEEKEKLIKNGDHRHILLIKKDQYVQKIKEKDGRYRAGTLIDYALAIKSEKHNNLELIASLNNKENYFYIKYKTGEHSLSPYETRTTCLNFGDKIKEVPHIDLNKLEDISCLRNLLAKR